MTVPNEILLEEVARLLTEGKNVELMTKCNSMLPYIIGNRDSVILRQEDGYRLRAGDIVLARRGAGVFVLHRIIAISGDELTLRGDGNVWGTETVRREDVLGRVIRIVHPSGKSCVAHKAFFWRHTGPLFRRCVLAAYRRTIYKILYR